MPADKLNDHAAADLLCAECHFIVATLHADGSSGVAQRPSELKALQSLENWCEQARLSIGPVDCYDYRGGKEFGIRIVEIEISKRVKELGSLVSAREQTK